MPAGDAWAKQCPLVRKSSLFSTLNRIPTQVPLSDARACTPSCHIGQTVISASLPVSFCLALKSHHLGLGAHPPCREKLPPQEDFPAF